MVVASEVSWSEPPSRAEAARETITLPPSLQRPAGAGVKERELDHAPPARSIGPELRFPSRYFDLVALDDVSWVVLARDLVLVALFAVLALGLRPSRGGS
jgi:hypothetical protein